MTRSQLISTVARKKGIEASVVEGVLNQIVEEITVTLKHGGKVTIVGFGRFEMRPRKTKAYTNPKTGRPSQLPPTILPGFKASGKLKKELGGKK